jgi:septal ring factor EnvC (AmiA/AmiB activator)
MIVDNGHGIMTLYGRNQELMFHTGQRIQKGDAIATVGNTGGFKQSALYFAVRKHGQPVNPAYYCH